MLRVKNAEEALVLAKAMCSRHPELVRLVSATNTPRDVAMKILISELQLGEPAAKIVQSTLKVPDHPAATTSSFSGYGGAAVSPKSRNAAAFPYKDGAMCAYCTEPTSRYCKETGRRHQSGEEKALGLWKKVFRQFAVASQFVSQARLAKKNTCVEDYAVELDF